MDLQLKPQKFPLLSFCTKKEVACPLFSASLLFICYNLIIIPLKPRSYLAGGIGFFSQIIPLNTKDSGSQACDYSSGNWVRDESYPLRTYNESCPFLDPGFRCHQSGRRDVDYLKWRWQPQGCDLPRFDAVDFLQRSRNGRMVFVGDSIGRNQWESMLCMLAQGVPNTSTIYEEHGNPISKHKGSLSIRFQEYNLTVEYHRSPFLVVTGRPPLNSPKDVRSTIRVDQLHWYSDKWVAADVLVFNAGHWWNEEKTKKMGYYFQEGGAVNMTMDIMEAFRRSLQTWKSWAVENLDPQRTNVFFRSYAPVHYRQIYMLKPAPSSFPMILKSSSDTDLVDGTWNDGGHCHTDMAPETNYTKLEPEPPMNTFISDVVNHMRSVKRKVQFLNITYLTEFRKDGHPSRHREPGTPIDAPQDCSHWCLPGVPDTWNELLYAHLLSMGFRTRAKSK
ncbi:hypothetical protein RJ640_020609 [Escallonia rubra]|uniref:Trichome birefringence-like N-terminal domain-containing protein n=1 Tax=Escallonia rubra TaxID=112253 RepID=A0AA88REH7_9ASTE|nr:hypothetical protein RJ640_020609 [Escallonia rubra]